MDWICIAPCRDKWRAVVTTVMIISDLLAKELLAYQEKLCSIKSDMCVCVCVCVCVCTRVRVCAFYMKTNMFHFCQQHKFTIKELLWNPQHCYTVDSNVYLNTQNVYPLQQWLCEHITMLCYTNTAYLVSALSQSVYTVCSWRQEHGRH